MTKVVLDAMCSKWLWTSSAPICERRISSAAGVERIPQVGEEIGMEAARKWLRILTTTPITIDGKVYADRHLFGGGGRVEQSLAVEAGQGAVDAF